MPTNDIDQVRAALADLTELMGWKANQTPRNMALALTARVGAVAGQLQFAGEGQPTPDQVTTDLRAELADCLVYLVALADALEVDMISEAARRLTSATAAERAPVG